MPVRGRLLDDVVAHVVAVANAVRNMEFRRAAAEFDGSLEDYDCGGAIDIVVAVDEDRLLVLDGGFDPVNGCLHAGHEVRRVQVSKIGSQETFGGFGFGDASHHQEAGERRGDARVFQA